MTMIVLLLLLLLLLLLPLLLRHLSPVHISSFVLAIHVTVPHIPVVAFHHPIFHAADAVSLAVNVHLLVSCLFVFLSDDVSHLSQLLVVVLLLSLWLYLC